MKNTSETGLQYSITAIDGIISVAGISYTIYPTGIGDSETIGYNLNTSHFKRATLGETLYLVHQAYLNRRNFGTEIVVNAAERFVLIGTTAILRTPQGIIAQDMPEIRNDRIVMNERVLTDILNNEGYKGSVRTEKGVAFNRMGGSIRSIPYGFTTGEQTPEQMRNNPFPIALTGDLEAGEKIAQILERTGRNGYIDPQLGQFAEDLGVRIPSFSNGFSSITVFDESREDEEYTRRFIKSFRIERPYVTHCSG